MDVLEKYYRVYGKIDLDSIYNNVVALKKNLSNETSITAVIKADGYGHGAVPIAHAIDDLVSSYAVATVYEGINLRKHNINKPIYILGFTHESAYEEAINYDLRMTVYNEETAKEINRLALKINKIAKIHIKIDTGMGRLGFRDNEESINVIKRISLLKGLVNEGIYTHFSSADDKNKDSTLEQLKRFNNFLNTLYKIGINIPIIHASNSAGIIDLPKHCFNTARAGISIYGLYPSEDVNKDAVILQPSLSLISHVIHIKDLDVGEGVGYGSTFITSRRSRVATIPIGYGDGYPRNLSNKGYVIINGKKAPIVGRVCMDHIMVDITDLENVENDNMVTLLGRDGNENITVEELSALAGTFNYEFVCNIGKRIPRVYYRNNKIIAIKDYFNDLYI